eukprot:5527478-Karenia_brevis.AAC.1
MPPTADLTLNIDASYVVKGIRNLQQGCGGVNADLWAILHKLLEDRTSHTRFCKVAAHLDDKAPSWFHGKDVQLHDLLGNALADGAAGKVAKHVQHSQAVIAQWSEQVNLARAVALRAAVIQQIHWESGKGLERYECPEP